MTLQCLTAFREDVWSNLFTSLALNIIYALVPGLIKLNSSLSNSTRSVNAASDWQCWHRNTIIAVALWEVGILRLKLNTELSALQEKELLSDREVLRMASSWYICHNTLVTGTYSCSSHRWLAHMIKLLSTTSQFAVKRLSLRRIADPVLLMTKNSVAALIEGTACEAVWLLWSCSLTHNATCSGIDQPIKWVLGFSPGKQNLSLCLGYFNNSIWSWATTSVHRGLTCH